MTTPAPVVPPKRLDSLTGMRFAAALAVFGRHCFYAFGPALASLRRVLPQGAAGVSFFFLLSGFVLTWSHRDGDPARSFYQRRFARIVPNNVATWALAIAVIAAGGGTVLIRQGAATLLLIQAWIPSHGTYLSVNSVSWSLSCELFFYALFPLLLRTFTRLPTGRRRFVMAALVAVPFVTAAIGSGAGPYAVRTWFLYIFPPVRLAEFALGILLALEVADGRWIRFGLAPAIALCLVAFAVDGFVPVSFTYVAVTMVPFGLLIASAAQADDSGARSPFRSAAAIKLGQWSYAFYLVHTLVLEAFFLLPHVQGHRFGLALALGASAALLGASVIASWALFHTVERPLERALRPGHTLSAVVS